ncbi:major facilitator superfamily transporter [Colletotrichum graminicola]|nr:major facilitator superfamily transporter [Colletotrichum graminicola]
MESAAAAPQLPEPIHPGDPPRYPRQSTVSSLAASNWPLEDEKTVHHGFGFQTTELKRANSHDSSSTAFEKDLEHVDSFESSFDDDQAKEKAKEGVLYHDGQLILQPAPTQDPRDPLNLPLSRKVIACACLCCFGALAAAAELILGAMLPVFALEYSGLDPKLLKPLTSSGGLPGGSDPLKILANLPGAPPIFQIYLLASLPVLIIGVANLILVPMAISVGRRPVVLATGLLAVIGCIWSGSSQSLTSHLLARCVQAIGAGTVESLVPFIIQDMVHVHQRNSWISGIFAIQGLIIIVLGIAAPYVIINLSWRYMYFITAISAAFFLVGVYFFLPETKWHRTRDEMSKCSTVTRLGILYKANSGLFRRYSSR